MRPAAKRVFEDLGMIEKAVNREVFRSEENQAMLMTRHARRHPQHD